MTSVPYFSTLRARHLVWQLQGQVSMAMVWRKMLSQTFWHSQARADTWNRIGATVGVFTKKALEDSLLLTICRVCETERNSNRNVINFDAFVNEIKRSTNNNDNIVKEAINEIGEKQGKLRTTFNNLHTIRNKYVAHADEREMSCPKPEIEYSWGQLDDAMNEIRDLVRQCRTLLGINEPWPSKVAEYDVDVEVDRWVRAMDTGVQNPDDVPQARPATC